MKLISWVILIVSVLSVGAALLGSKVKVMPDPFAPKEDDEPSANAGTDRIYIQFVGYENMNGWYANVPASEGGLILIRLEDQDVEE